MTFDREDILDVLDMYERSLADRADLAAEIERLRAHIAILTEEGHREIERLRAEVEELTAILNSHRVTYPGRLGHWLCEPNRTDDEGLLGYGPPACSSSSGPLDMSDKPVSLASLMEAERERDFYRGRVERLERAVILLARHVGATGWNKPLQEVLDAIQAEIREPW